MIIHKYDFTWLKKLDKKDKKRWCCDKILVHLKKIVPPSPIIPLPCILRLFLHLWWLLHVMVWCAIGQTQIETISKN